jgi:4-hydroxybenzoate polyprenyltransferase
MLDSRITAVRFVREIRVYQWVKNLLLFVPVVMAHRIHDLPAMLRVAAAFAAFCLASSAGYLINDLRDLASDREHPTKRYRMLASSALPPAAAWIGAPLLYAVAFAIAWTTGPSTAAYLAIYVSMTTIYSIALKKRIVIDVLILAALYTLRMLAGGEAAGVEVSTWLLAFAMFLFLSLALLKRYADLRLLDAVGVAGAAGRGYLVEDREMLRSIGVPSGLLAVLVFALYLAGEQVTRLYRTPRLLWLACPLLLYWVAHMWFLAERGEVHDDPIVAAAKDPASYAVGLMIAAIAFLAV